MSRQTFRSTTQSVCPCERPEEAERGEREGIKRDWRNEKDEEKLRQTDRRLAHKLRCGREERAARSGRSRPVLSLSGLFQSRSPTLLSVLCVRAAGVFLALPKGASDTLDVMFVVWLARSETDSEVPFFQATRFGYATRRLRGDGDKQSKSQPETVCLRDTNIWIVLWDKSTLQYLIWD